MVLLNYAVKSLIILMGLAVLGGIAPFDGMASPAREVFGAVAILYGAFRLVAYRASLRRQQDAHEDA
jgi:hypothetical protein